MDFLPGHRYTIRVKAKSQINDLSVVGEVIVVKVRDVAQDNAANAAVVTVFKEQLGVRCEIVRGHRSSVKQIRVL